MMAKRFAIALSLLAFIMCLLIGGIEADNTFVTSVYRALVAMAVMYPVGYVLGIMAQKMLDENLEQVRHRMEKSAAEQQAVADKQN